MSWITAGHGAQKAQLLRAWERGRLAHAYLISGPARIGRRRLALDIAKLANCLQPGEQGPCASCAQCSRIEDGIHADMALISTESFAKGASANRKNILIEQVHQLRRSAALKPYEGRRRVFIVDGAEKLSTEASNALLKTLEEPAGQTLIMLVAPAATALLPTIASRCQEIQLKPLDAAELERALESAPGDAELKRQAARLADGRVGWALAAAQDPTEMEAVEQARERCRAMAAGDLLDKFAAAAELAGRWRSQRSGVLGELDSWAAWWREMALRKMELPHGRSGEPPPQMMEIAGQLDQRQIAQAWEAIDAAKADLERNASPRVALEVMALRMPQPAPPA